VCVEWLDSGERVEDLGEIRAHVYLSGFIGNGEATDPSRIRERERERLHDQQARQKAFTSMPVLPCHTTMIKRPKQSWSNLKGFCLYIKMVYDSCNKRATFTVSFYAKKQQK